MCKCWGVAVHGDKTSWGGQSVTARGYVPGRAAGKTTAGVRAPLSQSGLQLSASAVKHAARRSYASSTILWALRWQTSWAFTPRRLLQPLLCFLRLLSCGGYLSAGDLSLPVMLGLAMCSQPSLLKFVGFAAAVACNCTDCVKQPRRAAEHRADTTSCSSTLLSPPLLCQIPLMLTRAGSSMGLVGKVMWLKIRSWC